jgi:hypothetical protein
VYWSPSFVQLGPCLALYLTRNQGKTNPLVPNLVYRHGIRALLFLHNLAAAAAANLQPPPPPRNLATAAVHLLMSRYIPKPAAVVADLSAATTAIQSRFGRRHIPSGAAVYNTQKTSTCLQPTQQSQKPNPRPPYTTSTPKTLDRSVVRQNELL